MALAIKSLFLDGIYPESLKRPARSKDKPDDEDDDDGWDKRDYG